MALDWSKDIGSLVEADLAELTADEKRILARLAESSPLYITHDLDRAGVPMQLVGNGAVQRARMKPGSVALALLRGWTKV